jgi:hypothetical protein
VAGAQARPHASLASAATATTHATPARTVAKPIARGHRAISRKQ